MPRVVDRQERRSSLIEAATLVFAENGYHGATMQQVAERAGVSKGGLYEYFPSKDELLLETAETMIDDMFEEALSRFESNTAPLHRRVIEHAEYMLSQVPRWAEFSRSMRQVWAELGDPNDPLGRLVSRIYRENADRVQAIFDRAIETGECVPFPTRPAVLSIMAAIDGILIQAVLAPDEFRAYSKSGAFPQLCAALIPEPGPEQH